MKLQEAKSRDGFVGRNNYQRFWSREESAVRGMNNDGQIDLLIARLFIMVRGTSQRTELPDSMTFSGDIYGDRESDPEKISPHKMTLGFQIHDIDDDGKNEVIYCMNFEIIVAEGSNGKS